MNNIKQLIEKQLLDILVEKSTNKPEDKSEKPKDKPSKPKKKKSKMPPGTISTKGAFGSGGRPTRFILNQKARAESDPKGLMKDLGVVANASGNDVSKAESILNQSIHANPLMAQAYVGARVGASVSVEGEKLTSVVIVTVGELSKKDGIRFLANVLEAAKNAGMMTLEGSLQFVQGSGDLILLQSV